MMTFQQAVELLSSPRLRDDRIRKIGNNTYLVRRGPSAIAIRLHATDVVTIYSDGTYALNSNGWRTPTTKERINKYGPVRVYQKKRKWYADLGTRIVSFHDGMMIFPCKAQPSPEYN